MKRAKGFRCREHQGAERPCGPARCGVMAEVQALEDRVLAIVHLAGEGRDEALGADGLTPSAALEAIKVRAAKEASALPRLGARSPRPAVGHSGRLGRGFRRAPVFLQSYRP